VLFGETELTFFPKFLGEHNHFLPEKSHLFKSKLYHLFISGPLGGRKRLLIEISDGSLKIFDEANDVGSHYFNKLNIINVGFGNFSC